MSKSDLEQAFETYLIALGHDLPEPTRQYRFAPPRRWRFDLAWVDHRVAIELQGGSWVNGRHNRGKGVRDDYEKFNAALLAGWKVLLFTTDMLNDDPVSVFRQIRQALALNGEKMVKRGLK